MKYKQNRNKLLYFILIIFIIILGLSTRKYPTIFPNLITKYGGDVLWASMVYLGFALIFNKLPLYKIAIFSLTFSYLIETSQLYHASWIDKIRHTTIGGLILGFGFLWSDIICYTIGIFIAGIIDIAVTIFTPHKTT